MYTLGIDIGSSSIKVCVFNSETGKMIGNAGFPDTELDIVSLQTGWAEQDPEVWWDCFLKAFQKVLTKTSMSASQIGAIGISYQMHGLVVVDKNNKLLRSSIIWCDSRAVPYGENAYREIGPEKCTCSLLNSPGNFTAAKLKWVKENEPDVFESIDKIMLPGDYIALKLSGEITTTATGLSEGVFWDFEKGQVSQDVLDHFGFSADLIPEIVPAFGEQSAVSKSAAELTGLIPGTLITYRAGDQPNNAFSLNVLNPGEIAATAGTSGVIYAVTDKNSGDPQSRVNTFLHVNGNEKVSRNGILLCLNGTGILNSWIRKNIGMEQFSYDQMNNEASNVTAGAEGLKFYPFGNGAERVLGNQLLMSSLQGLDFNRHTYAHIFRAAQEGIVYGLKYGFEVLEELGVEGKTIRAGLANMFLSPVFREIFVNTIGLELELYETDGAEGAARGAALGAGYYSSEREAFASLKALGNYYPEKEISDIYQTKYTEWKQGLPV